MSRIYKVKIMDEEVLVRAGTRGAATRFAMSRAVETDVASQDDIVRLISKGVAVQDATKKGRAAA